jgi:hypothetical protein
MTLTSEALAEQPQNKTYRSAVARIDVIAESKEDKIYELIAKLEGIMQEKEFPEEMDYFLSLLLEHLQLKLQLIEQRKEIASLKLENEKNKKQKEESAQPASPVVLKKEENKPVYASMDTSSSYSSSYSS